MNTESIQMISAVGSICAFLSVMITVFVMIYNDWMKKLDNIEAEYLHRDALLEQDLRNKQGNFWSMVEEHHHRFQCESSNKFEDICTLFVSTQITMEARLSELIYKENIYCKNRMEVLRFPTKMTFD